VVGKADAARGQIVKAFVVLRKQYSASEALSHDCKSIASGSPHLISILERLSFWMSFRKPSAAKFAACS